MWALEPGMYFESHCLDGIKVIYGDSLGSFGNKGQLRLKVNNTFLLPDRDFRFNQDSSQIELAFTPSKADSFCVDVARSPLIESWNWNYFSLNNIPVLSKSSRLENNLALKSGENLDNQTPEYRLDYGGNKSISLRVGEGGGLQLDQSLQLDLNGQVSKNMFITGHLSDQEIPIQPEGKTATLKEVDNIYVKIWGLNYSYTLGDYLFDFGEDRVDSYLANVQGINGHYNKGAYGLKAAYSRSRGKYNHINFQGNFGQQTGYFLRGENGNDYITILAGTEKIYRNGELLKRGEHYQIEDGEGRLDFTNNLIVNGDDNFTAEYQYTDQDYPTTLLSLQFSDSAGAFTWSLRGITEMEDATQYSGGSFSEEDKNTFADYGNADKQRSSGVYSRDLDEGWVDGLYYESNGVYVYVAESIFDSLNSAAQDMYSVRFSQDVQGGYGQVQGLNGLVYYGWQQGNGGFSPGEVVPLPSRKSHVTLNLGYNLADSSRQNFFSSLHILQSEWDPNLLSAKSEGDNWDGGFLHSTGINIGKPLDKAGLGLWKLRSDIKYKREDYKAFQQLEESYYFEDTWNVSSIYGEAGFYSGRLNLENEFLSGYKIGGEAGRLYSLLPDSDSKNFAESNRKKGYFSIDKNKLKGKLFLEQKESEEEYLNKENLKWGGQYQQGFGIFTPQLNLVQDNWSAEVSENSEKKLTRSKLDLALPSEIFWDVIQIEPGGRLLKWESNFSGLDNKRDSLISWDVYQKINVMNLGNWQSELFVSYQQLEERYSAQSDKEKKNFKLLEWNNRYQDIRRGISLFSNYKINQTVEVPLLEVYQQVAEGTGTHVCDTIAVETRLYLDCREDADKGNQKFLGLRRDSLSQGISVQELNFSGTLGWSPVKSIPGLSGFLADVYLGLRYDISSKQDSAKSTDIFPLISDRRINEALEGKSSLNPFLNWKNEQGKKSWELSYERQYFHSELQYDRREKLHRIRSQFNQDISEDWSYFLHAFGSRNWRKSNESGPSDSTLSYGAGTQWEYHLGAFWKILPIFDYENSSGIYNLSANQPFESFGLHSVFPKLRLERELFKAGRAFGEYGLKYLWGQGEPNYRLSNYIKGRTHRFQAGMDMQIGQYVFANANYLLRMEPGREKLFQSLSAELRAIF